ncbi:MAG: hypothetical protein R3B94_06820 [Hyphomonas sp.]
MSLNTNPITKLLDLAVSSAADFTAMFLRTILYLTINPLNFQRRYGAWRRAQKILSPHAILFVASYVLSAALLISPVGLDNYLIVEPYGRFALLVQQADEAVHSYLLDSGHTLDLLTLFACGAPIILGVELSARAFAWTLSYKAKPAQRRNLANIAIYAVAYHALFIGMSVGGPSFLWLIFEDPRSLGLVRPMLVIKVLLHVLAILVPVIVILMAIWRSQIKPRNVIGIAASYGLAILAAASIILPIVAIVFVSGSSLNKASWRWASKDVKVFLPRGLDLRLFAFNDVYSDARFYAHANLFVANGSNSPLLIGKSEHSFVLSSEDQKYILWDILVRRRGQACPQENIVVPAASGVELELFARQRALLPVKAPTLQTNNLEDIQLIEGLQEYMPEMTSTDHINSTHGVMTQFTYEIWLESYGQPLKVRESLITRFSGVDNQTGP